MNPVTVGQADLTPGTYGPFTSDELPADATKFLLQITKLAWPQEGSGEVMTLTVDESNDGGTSWRWSATDTWHGGLTVPKGGGSPSSTDSWWADLLFPPQANRKLRLTLQVLQPCTVSGSVDVL